MREIKDHSLRTKDFQEHFLHYVTNTFDCKKYFQLHKWSFCFFRPQNTRHFSFLLMSVEKDQRSQVENKNFWNIYFVLEILDRYLPTVKTHSQFYKLMYCFIRSHIIRTFLFLLKLVWGRSKTTVWEKKIIFCSRTFRQVSTHHKNSLST